MWFEFKIKIQDSEDDPESWFSKGLINCENLKSVYATLDNQGRKVCLLVFDELMANPELENSLAVYESYSEVKKKLQPLIKLPDYESD